MISAERHTLAFNTSTAAMLASESCADLLKQLRGAYGVTETADILAGIAIAFTDAESTFLDGDSRTEAAGNGWDDAQVTFDEALDTCVHIGLLAALPAGSWNAPPRPPLWEAELNPAVTAAFWTTVRGS